MTGERGATITDGMPVIHRVRHLVGVRRAPLAEGEAGKVRYP